IAHRLRGDFRVETGAAREQARQVTPAIEALLSARGRAPAERLPEERPPPAEALPGGSPSPCPGRASSFREVAVRSNVVRPNTKRCISAGCAGGAGAAGARRKAGT